jgi:hypothetical protein
MNKVVDFEALVSIIETGSSAVVDVAAELARAQATLQWNMSRARPSRSTDDTEDVLVGAVEAARRLNMSVEWVYKNAKEFPFTVRNSRKLQFSTQGIERYKRRNTGRTA